jgi:hypothetical protein
MKGRQTSVLNSGSSQAPTDLQHVAVDVDCHVREVACCLQQLPGQATAANQCSPAHTNTTAHDTRSATRRQTKLQGLCARQTVHSGAFSSTWRHITYAIRHARVTTAWLHAVCYGTVADGRAWAVPAHPCCNAPCAIPAPRGVFGINPTHATVTVTVTVLVMWPHLCCSSPIKKAPGFLAVMCQSRRRLASTNSTRHSAVERSQSWHSQPLILRDTNTGPGSTQRHTHVSHRT